MRVLQRKVLRDVSKSGGLYATVCLMVILGVSFLIGSYAVYENLAGSYENSYRRLRFEDFSIRFNSASSGIVARLEEIPGVEAVEGRLVEETSLELGEGSKTKLAGRLIGIPTRRQLRLNHLKVTKGRMPRSGSEEVLLEAAFAGYHKVKPGQTVVVSRGTSRLSLRVCGIVQSNEYLYVVRSKQDLISMPDTFGVMFIDEDVLGGLFRRNGEINEVHATVLRPERLTAIMRSFAAELKSYEPEDPVPRVEQPSYQMLQQDVQGFQSYAVLFPLLFLSVAAVSVYSMLTRVVHAQRPEIGLLRSLGLSRVQIVRHYLSGTLIIGAVGSLLGCGLGVVFGNSLSRFYMSRIQVPYPELLARPGVMLVGFVVGIGVCGFAGIFPSWAAAKIRPAEAMRPVTPTFGRYSIRLDALIPNLSIIGKIPLRNVFRQPRRTISTLVGVIAGMCLMITARGLLDSTKVAIDQLLASSFGFDLRVDFYVFQSKRVLSSVRAIDGVIWTESLLELPVEFRHGSNTYSGLINGLEPESRLRSIVDDKGKEVSISERGAIFGPTLRKRLDLNVGDKVEVFLSENMTKESSTKRIIEVAGFCQETIGTQAYLPRWKLESLFRDDLDLPGNALTSILISCDPGKAETIRTRLLQLPNAASAMSMKSMRTMVEDLMKTSSRFIYIMELFGAALAFATIFNMITVNVLERQSEVATLRTLGVPRFTIAKMVLAENMIVALIGIAMGLPIGNAFVNLFWRAAQTEEQQDLFTFNVVVLPWTYWQAAIAIISVAAISLIPALRYVGRLDLSRAVKERSN